MKTAELVLPSDPTPMNTLPSGEASGRCGAVSQFQAERPPDSPRRRRHAMVIRKEIQINAPLSVVWNVFSRMEQWREWNDVCRNCCYVDGDEMAVDACFSFEIAPLYIPMKVQPRILRCDPGKEVVWAGGRLGVRAEHTFRFWEEGGGVRVLSEETFQGPLLAVGRLLRVPQRLHRLTEAFMEAIKRRAEACAA